MCDQTLVQCASPTLAGLKTASLFSQPYRNTKELLLEIRAYNRRLRPKGMCLIPVAAKKGRVLLYLYRPKRLEADLSAAEAEEILQKAGYEPGNSGHIVYQLVNRLENKGEFPHEIGVFLGYPPEDVKGFIENRAKNCKCVGCWKVYGNVDAAKKTFRAYRNCTECYRKQLEKGVPLEHLLVG